MAWVAWGALSGLCLGWNSVRCRVEEMTWQSDEGGTRLRTGVELCVLTKVCPTGSISFLAPPLCWPNLRQDGHAGQGGLPHEINLRRGQAVGRSARSLSARSSFKVSAAWARAGSIVQAPERGAWEAVSGRFLPRMCFTSPRCRNRGRPWRAACCWAFRSRIPPAASRATCAGSVAGGM